MGTYNSAVITNGGQSMIAQAVAGASLEFTTIKTSSYAYPAGTNLATLTTINGIKQSKDITGAAVYNSRVIKISAAVDNTGISTAYAINTIGIYAKVGSSAESLFAVVTASAADTMPAYDSKPYSYIYEISLTMQNAANVTVTVNAAGLVNVADLNAAKVEIRGEIADLKSAKVDKDGYKEVNELNTVFFNRNENIYNVDDVTDGVRLNQIDEGVFADAAYTTSGFIYVGNINKTVKFWRLSSSGVSFYNDTAYYVLYDAFKQRLGSRKNTTSVDVTSAVWMRVSNNITYKSTFMILDEDITPTSYIPFGYKFAYGTQYYDTVADMIADDNIKIGQNVKTLGYYSKNDGGGAEYTISNSAQWAVLADSPWCILLGNGLFANIGYSGAYDARQLGVKIYKNGISAGTAEDSTGTLNTALMASIPFANLPFRYELYIPDGFCNVSGTLYLRNGNVLRGAGWSTSRINQYPTGNENVLLKVGVGLINGEEVADYGSVTNNGYSKTVDGLWFATDGTGIESMGDGWIIRNCWFNGGGTGIRCRGADAAVNNCLFDITIANGIIIGNDNASGGDNGLSINNCLLRSSTNGIIIKTLDGLAINNCVFSSVKRNCIVHSEGRAEDVAINSCLFISSTQTLEDNASQVLITNDQVYANWVISGCVFRSSESSESSGLKIDGARFVNVTGCSFVKNHYGIVANNTILNVTGCKFRLNIDYDVILGENVGTVVAPSYLFTGCSFDQSHLRISSNTNRYHNSCILDKGTAKVRVADCYSSDARAIISSANPNCDVDNCSSANSYSAMFISGTECKCINTPFVMWTSDGESGAEAPHDGAVITGIVGTKKICSSASIPTYTNKDICMSTQRGTLGWQYNGTEWVAL